MASFASFLLNHFADRLDAIEPTVPFGFGLERRRGNEIAISRMKHFSSQEPITGFLWTIADAVVRDVDDLVVVCLNGESHIESKDAVAHVSQGVAGWRNDLSLNLRAFYRKRTCIASQQMSVLGQDRQSAPQQNAPLASRES